MPVSMEFSIARRKLVSATSACCACMRRRVWRQLPISIQAVITLQRADQPEQAAADHAQRGAVGLRAQHQAVAHRRDRHFVFVGLRGPGQQLRAGLRGGTDGAGEHAALAVEQRHRVARRHLGRHAVAQQAVDRVLAQDHAGERPWSASGTCSCSRPALSLPATGCEYTGCCRSRARLYLVSVSPGRSTSPVARCCCAGHAGRRVAGLDAAALVDPGERLQLGVLARPATRRGRRIPPGRPPCWRRRARCASAVPAAPAGAGARAAARIRRRACTASCSRSISSSRRYQKAETMAARNSSTAASGASIAKRSWRPGVWRRHQRRHHGAGGAASVRAREAGAVLHELSSVGAARDVPVVASSDARESTL